MIKKMTRFNDQKLCDCRMTSITIIKTTLYSRLIKDENLTDHIKDFFNKQKFQKAKKKLSKSNLLPKKKIY